MKDVKKAFEMIVESLKIPTHKTIKELIKRLESLEKTVAKSIVDTKAGAKPKATPSKKKESKAGSVKKATPTQKGVAKKRKKAAPKSVSGETSMTDQIFSAIQKSSTGVTVGTLREATGIESKQVSNIVFRLLRQGRIVKKDRGVYAIK
ncbi:MAG: hypothetical protein ACFFCW_46420 [Candidatus Hodarchaeota archaeon]